jgi:hypothetical protein
MFPECLNVIAKHSKSVIEFVSHKSQHSSISFVLIFSFALYPCKYESEYSLYDTNPLSIKTEIVKEYKEKREFLY